MANPTLVQQINSDAITAAGATVNFGVASTSGNLLVMVLGGDKDAGVLTATGWTILFSLRPATNVSLYFCYKVSAGDTGGTFSWTSASGSGHSIWMGEYSDADSGAWTLLGSGSNITSEANVTSWSTGTSSSTTAAGLAIAAVAWDSWFNITGTLAWTNSFTARFGVAGSGGLSHGYSYIAEKQVGAAETPETTFSHTGTADQAAGCIAVFGRASTVSTTPTFVRPVQSPLQITR